MRTASGNIAVILVAGIALLFSTAAWGADVDPGKSIYEGRCQFCHGSKGNGNGPAAASLNPKPADFNEPAFWQKNNKKKMADIIQEGKGMMPAFDMKPDEVKAVIDYITRTYKKPK
jgi:mono/diheme cytochrome c family protein